MYQDGILFVRPVAGGRGALRHLTEANRLLKSTATRALLLQEVECRRVGNLAQEVRHD